MEAIIAKLRIPFFSIKRYDTYQISYSYIFLMPSSIVGSIGNSLALLGECKGEDCINLARKIVKKAREYFPRKITFSKSPVILKRVRGMLEDKEMPKSLAEFVSSSDALVREYVVSEERNILILTDKPSQIIEAVKIMDRLGDSESLLSVIYVKESKIGECEKEDGVNVMIKNEIVSQESRGDQITVDGFDELGKKSVFYIPVEVKGYSIKPSPIKTSKVMCAGDAVFPEGDNW
ncbi:MAG: type I-A CRISPR-associated protein Cas5a [Sulfolobus sp.]